MPNVLTIGYLNIRPSEIGQLYYRESDGCMVVCGRTPPFGGHRFAYNIKMPKEEADPIIAAWLAIEASIADCLRGASHD